MNKFQQIKTSFYRFVKGTDFSKAILMAVAAVIPILVFIHFNQLPFGIAMTIGVLLCAPSDVPGNLRHRFFGMLFAIFFGMFATFCIGYTVHNLWLNIPLFFILTFCIAYFSVYGFRASLITLTGLLAMVLAYAKIATIGIGLHVLLIGAGGVWYLILSTLFLKLRPKKHVELLLGEAFEKTAELLSIRGKLLAQDKQREHLQKQQVNLQSSINELHENIRESLLSNRKVSGASNSSRRKLLVFIELVDILELSLAHPVNFKRVDKLKQEDPSIILLYKTLTDEIALQLKHIAHFFIDSEKLNKPNRAQAIILDIEKNIAHFYETKEYPESRGMLLLLRNVLDFEKKQQQKIQTIHRILGNIEKRNQLKVNSKEVKQFLTPTDYSFSILRENFSISSPMFRHALRLAVLMVIGIIIGHYFKLQNSYWILLTIVVIIRPSYGLTKERSINRIIGTLLGGAIAVLCIFLISNPLVYAVLGVISLILAFSMIQKNYAGAAAFITLNVIFIYALLQPNALAVIQYRVIDTLIGATLAVMGNLWLWPSWQHQEMPHLIVKVIKANIDYLQSIRYFYKEKGTLPAHYKLNRKQAFLAMGNLSAAFQRMTQEPKSKQKEYRKYYRYTSLNHTFLSSLASLGTFIRNHKTTNPNTFFETYAHNIVANLKEVLEQLEPTEKKCEHTHIDFTEANIYIGEQEEKLNVLREKEIETGAANISNELRNYMQELQLVSEQLRWLYEISSNLKKVQLSKEAK